MSNERPNPQSARDLRLMYETCGRVDGNIEYKSLKNKDFEDGDIVSIRLRVVPSKDGEDKVVVLVEREQISNVRKSDYGGYGYSSRYIIDYKRCYTFAEFKESPFYDMCIGVWGDMTGMAHPVFWDTHEMDDHVVSDEGNQWFVSAHVYEHHYSWFRNWVKTGLIDHVYITLDEDGNVDVSITHNDEYETVYDGDIWSLRDIIREHQEMKESLAKLKKHGIDLDSGTLSIKLWEE